MALIKEEQIKEDKNPFDSFEDLKKAAREGFASIKEHDFLRFKYFGFYQQRPKTEPYFFLRLKLPGGRVNSKQLRVIAELARDYSKGITDLTTRQAFQLHWLKVEDLPAIFKKLEAVNINTRGAGGDAPRNITSSPLAGIEQDEAGDVQDTIEELGQILVKDKTFSNLPRKFKVSISGSLQDASQPEINDVGIYGFKKAGDKEPRFAIQAGGGLSRDPMLGKKLPVALKKKDIVPVVTAICEIFKEFGNRENRRKARLKFLVESWGPEKLLKEVEHRIGYNLERCEEVPIAENFPENYFGVIPQKQKGLVAIGLSVLTGCLTSDKLLGLADLSEKYGSGEFKTTNQQNIILINIQEKNTPSLKKDLIKSGFNLGENGVHRGVVACTGNEFCNLALVETKAFARKLTARLVSKFPDVKDTIPIHISGCPNSCAQQQVAAIGLMGAIKMVDGKKYDAFHIYLGGSLGGESSFSKKVFDSIPVGDIPELLETIIETYFENRNSDDSFVSFCARYSPEELTELFQKG